MPSRNRTAPAEETTEAVQDESAAVAESRAKRQGPQGGSKGGRVSGSVVGSGWAAYKTAKNSTSKFKNEFKIADLLPARYIGKFLEDGPFAVYTQHYYKRDGKQYFICTEDCPLCAINETPTVYALFNVLDLNGAQPVVKFWRATPAPAKQIEEFEEEGPINATDRYFSAHKKESATGYNEFVVREILDVKLKEKAGFDPFTEAELDEYRAKCFTEDQIVTDRSTYAELEALAAELFEGED